jgi:hypothetical protein
MIRAARMRRRLTFAGVTVAVIAAAAATMAMGSSATQRQSLPDLLTVHNQPGIAASLSEHFALFRQTPQGLPADAQAALSTGNLASAFGLDLSHAERVVSGDLTLWIVAGSAGVCEYILGLEVNGVSECAYSESADAGTDMLRNIANDGSETLVGLAPDGNATVTIKDGPASTAVPVIDNVYVYRNDGQSLQGATVTVDDAAGARESYSAP